ncbi:hypothetical protein, partial [Microvirga aerilata]|uniref:hypothetical protein n=1 Tax=Microvirga aerilata TaxID=670292 RepID=UPI001AEEC485
QLALIEEARAARRTMQQVAEAADARVLTIEPDRQWLGVKPSSRWINASRAVRDCHEQSR